MDDQTKQPAEAASEIDHEDDKVNFAEQIVWHTLLTATLLVGTIAATIVLLT